MEEPTERDHVSFDEIEALRQEVQNEIGREERNLSLIGRHSQRAHRLIPLLIAVLILNLIFLFTIPNYGLYWIVASFFVYMYYFIVLLFPTTRRIRSPGEKRMSWISGTRTNRRREFKGVIVRGKKAVAIAFWNSFFIGTQTLARGIDLILAVSLIFVILGLVRGTLDLFSATVVILQIIAIMGYYQVIIHYRPYSKDFLRTVGRVRRSRNAQLRWVSYFKGVFIVLVLAAIFAVFLVSAIFLPKKSLDTVVNSLDASIVLTVLGLVVIFASHFIIIRYLQGFDSARITSLFIHTKLSFLRSEIWSGLDRLEGRPMDEEGRASFRALRRRFEVSRIYRIAYKDIFGILPTYPIIVDFSAILEKDVADALDEEIPLDLIT
ncbi:MAG: hypothetical protein SA339_01870 [Methanomassiliicoccus sp.]|nr:hypothetical protein [Methanomassiliicoccus sp.]